MYLINKTDADVEWSGTIVVKLSRGTVVCLRIFDEEQSGGRRRIATVQHKKSSSCHAR